MERILKTLPVPVNSYIAMDISPLSTFSHMNYLGSENIARIGMVGESMLMAPEQVECLQRIQLEWGWLEKVCQWPQSRWNACREYS